jgi:hypothetical protein
MPYHIGHFAGIKAKIQRLAEQAQERGIRKAYLDALTEITTNLRTRPLEWGDPEYNTNKEGGVVCHGIVHPVLVRFSVHEPEQTVLIFDVQLLT